MSDDTEAEKPKQLVILLTHSTTPSQMTALVASILTEEDLQLFGPTDHLKKVREGILNLTFLTNFPNTFTFKDFGQDIDIDQKLKKEEIKRLFDISMEQGLIAKDNEREGEFKIQQSTSGVLHSIKEKLENPLDL